MGHFSEWLRQDNAPDGGFHGRCATDRTFPEHEIGGDVRCARHRPRQAYKAPAFVCNIRTPDHRRVEPRRSLPAALTYIFRRYGLHTHSSSPIPPQNHEFGCRGEAEPIILNRRRELINPTLACIASVYTVFRGKSTCCGSENTYTWYQYILGSAVQYRDTIERKSPISNCSEKTFLFSHAALNNMP